WLGITPARREDGTLGSPAELGDQDSFDDLLAALATPALAAVTVMHASPEAIPDSIEMTRRHFAGPIGAYAEPGRWTPPDWVFDGLTPDQYLRHASTWAERGAQLIGGCCGTGPGHIRVLAERLPRHRTTPAQATKPGRRPGQPQPRPPLPPSKPVPANNR